MVKMVRDEYKKLTLAIGMYSNYIKKVANSFYIVIRLQGRDYIYLVNT